MADTGIASTCCQYMLCAQVLVRAVLVSRVQQMASNLRAASQVCRALRCAAPPRCSLPMAAAVSRAKGRNVYSLTSLLGPSVRDLVVDDLTVRVGSSCVSLRPGGWESVDGGSRCGRAAACVSVVCAEAGWVQGELEPVRRDAIRRASGAPLADGLVLAGQRCSLLQVHTHPMPVPWCRWCCRRAPPLRPWSASWSWSSPWRRSELLRQL